MRPKCGPDLHVLLPNCQLCAPKAATSYWPWMPSNAHQSPFPASAYIPLFSKCPKPCWHSKQALTPHGRQRATRQPVSLAHDPTSTAVSGGLRWGAGTFNIKEFYPCQAENHWSNALLSRDDTDCSAKASPAGKNKPTKSLPLKFHGILAILLVAGTAHILAFIAYFSYPAPELPVPGSKKLVLSAQEPLCRYKCVSKSLSREVSRRGSGTSHDTQPSPTWCSMACINHAI